MTIRILTVTTLFPNPAQPHHGVFVRNRLSALLDHGGVSATVLAPVAWTPPGASRAFNVPDLRAVPLQEEWRGVTVLHPRYVVIPKIGMTAAPSLLYATLRRAVDRILAAGSDFDLIDAHYFYPDGVAAALLGAALGKPVVITARGSDLTLLPKYWAPRRMIKWAASRADGLVTVCADLRERLIDLGVPDERPKVLTNGVDLTLYRPADQRTARLALGLDPRRLTIGSVGHLIERKGHDLVIEAIKDLPEIDLVIVGEGPERARLTRLGQQLGLSDRIKFLGTRPPDELASIYPAFDALVLASSREGWANVLLEAMACDVPVVATAVGGTPEVVTEPAAGRLVQDRTPEALSAAIRQQLATPRVAGQTRSFAERHSWRRTSEGLQALFETIMENRPPRR